MKLKHMLVLASAVVFVSSAQAVTIATHQDPSSGSPTVFSIDVANSVVNAGWTNPGLTLSVPIASGTYSNVFMAMSPVAILSTNTVGLFTIHTLGAGEIRYYDSDFNNPLFQINFGSASVIEPVAASASDFTANNVSFSGSAIAAYAGLLTSEVVNYSFANPSITGGVSSYTASMTTSAEVVPEPATMAVLGLVAAAVARRRSRR